MRDPSAVEDICLTVLGTALILRTDPRISHLQPKSHTPLRFRHSPTIYPIGLIG